MLPLSDGLHPRRFPFVNVLLIAANFAVWILYELPHLGSAVHYASFYPCAVDGSCHAPEAWGISWFTAMFMHGSWDHILGNMLFLAIFGKNVEDTFGHLRYLGFSIAGGFIATMTQAVVTLHFASAPARTSRRSAPAERSPPCSAIANEIKVITAGRGGWDRRESVAADRARKAAPMARRRDGARRSARAAPGDG